MDAIIFDVDGTLWDSTESVAKGWNAAIKEHGGIDLTLTGERLKSEFGKPMNVICGNLFPMLTKEEQLAFLDPCCEWEHKMLEKFGGVSFGDIRSTMKLLSKKYDLYIVSNCQLGYIELVMRHLNIEDLIKDHLCFGNTGTSKGLTILKLMEKNNIKNPVYIGDTDGDLNACKEAGIPFVFAKYGFGHTEHPDYTIDSFEELTKIFL